MAVGGSRSRDHSEGSPQSRHSRMNRGLMDGLDNIPERDPMLEQTGVGGANNYDAFSQPIGSKTRQQEWEEAVELDKVLENERRKQSQKRLEASQDE